MFKSKSVLLCWRTILASHALGIVATCAIVVSGWGLHKSFSSKIESLIKQKVEETKLSQRKSGIQADYEKLQPKLAQLQESTRTLCERIPTHAQETEYLQQISNLANEIGLDIQDFRPGQTTPLAPLLSRDVQIHCTADFKALCEFVTQLSTLPRISRIVMLNINEPKEAGGKCATELQIQIIFGTIAPAPNETLTQR